MDLISEVILNLIKSAEHCIKWLVDFWNSCGNVTTTFLTLFIIFTGVRLLLVPLLGMKANPGSSDRARPSAYMEKQRIAMENMKYKR